MTTFGFDARLGMRVLAVLLLLILSPVTVSADWWNGSWYFRREITLTNVGSTELLDFPAYINISYDSYMQPDFDDLRFINDSCDSDSTVLLDYEIEYYDSDNAVVWLRIPTFPAGTKTICMYYCNPSASSGENATAVWDNDYVLVMHLSETSGMYYDSTKYGNNGTLVDSDSDSVRGAAGAVDGAIDFNGDSDYITIPDHSSLDITGDITLEIWTYPNVFSIEPDILTKGSYTQAYSMWYNRQNYLRFALNDDRLTSTGYTINRWVSIAATRAGSDRRIYIDGILNVSDTYSSAIGTTDTELTIGTSSYSFNGIIDEVRISNISRTYDWVNQSYQLVANQENLVSFGTKDSLIPLIFRSLPDPITSDETAHSNTVLWNPSSTTVSVDYVEELWYNSAAIDAGTCTPITPASGLSCSCSAENCSAVWNDIYDIGAKDFQVFRYSFANDGLSAADVQTELIVNVTQNILINDTRYVDFSSNVPAGNVYLSLDNVSFDAAQTNLTRIYNDTIYVELVAEGGTTDMTTPIVLRVELDDEWSNVESPGNTVWQEGGRWYINYTLESKLTKGTSQYFAFNGVTPDKVDKAEVNATIYNLDVNVDNIHELLLNIYNTQPTLDGADIIPDPAYTCYNLTCVNGSASDPDGDTVSFKYRWYRNGVLIQGQTEENLSGDHFNATDSIYCDIRPYDGIDDGDAVNSPILTITKSGVDDPCNESCSYDIDCTSDNCCIGVCTNDPTCCGEDGCETGESILNCPVDCCDYDCTAMDDDVCHLECQDYCVGVNETCDDKTINSCGNETGDCLGCQYYDCPYTLCVDSCYGNRWREGDDVPNTCDVGGTEECSSNQCSWSYTCDYDYASGCGSWQCDEDGDCTAGYVCTSYCACVKTLFRVWTGLKLSTTGVVSRSEYLWLAQG
jgi:hypothetical protein